MEKKYSVTYKVVKAGAEYVYQQNKGDHKAGDSHSSSGGHMWYALSDREGSVSYGFESKFDEMRGPGQVGSHAEKRDEKRDDEKRDRFIFQGC